MSGTGIRDSVEGGYLEPRELGVSCELAEEISSWLKGYEDAHYDQYQDQAMVAALDDEGLRICRQLRKELVGVKVEYYSSARMQRMPTEP